MVLECIVMTLTSAKDHTLFHEEPLSEEASANGFTRPYRWHMDAPLYENLPGFATVLHALEVPEVPDQKLAFPDGREMNIAAGATACTSAQFYLRRRSFLDSDKVSSLLRRSEFRVVVRRGTRFRHSYDSAVRTASLRMNQGLQGYCRWPEYRSTRQGED